MAYNSVFAYRILKHLVGYINAKGHHMIEKELPKKSVSL